MRHSLRLLALRLLAVLAPVFAAACLPVTSTTPVGTTVGFRPDPALPGVWLAKGQDGGAPSYVHFIGNSDGTMTALLIAPPQDDNLGEWSEYRLRAATLGANRFIDAEEVSDNGAPAEGPLAGRNVVLLYRWAGPRKLTFYRMNDKGAAAAIAAGELMGVVEEDGDVTITSQQPALDAFMKTPRAARLFDKPLAELTKLGP